MIALTLSKCVAAIPSRIKYRCKPLRRYYNQILRLGQPIFNVQSRAGTFRWAIDEITSQEYLRGVYEEHMQAAFLAHITPGMVVYDIGAHAGFHSLFCASLGAQVFAFEPNPENRASLSRQIALNAELSVSVLPFALSDRCAQVRFKRGPTSSMGFVSESGESEVEARTIDSLDIPSPELLKIDVEGHETQVLAGATATITQAKPVILCDSNDHTTYTTVGLVLKPLGYRVLPGPPITAIPCSPDASLIAEPLLRSEV
jgi:FkbM family methyltransferase